MGVLGNDVAVKAYQQGTLPFPDGTILVKLAWKHVSVAGPDGAFVTGPDGPGHGQGRQQIRNDRRLGFRSFQ